MKTLRLLASILFLLPVQHAVAQSQLPEIVVTPVDENVTKLWVNDYVNVLLIRCGDQNVLIDAGFQETAEQLASKIAGMGVEYIDYLINTHSNGDHTGGNAVLGGVGSIISHANCGKELAAQEGFPTEGLPTTTFTDSMRIACETGAIELIGMPGAHTNNDVVAYLTEHKILYLGDIIVPETFPVIWLNRYGDEVGVERLAEVLGTILRRYDDDTRILSAHGRDYSMDELADYRDMVVATTELVRNAFAAGKTLEQMRSTNLLGDWVSWNSHKWEWINADNWIETIYTSLGR